MRCGRTFEVECKKDETKTDNVNHPDVRGEE